MIPYIVAVVIFIFILTQAVKIMNEYDEDIGFTTEFIFELVDSARY